MESKISMILANSSSFLKGMVIFPFPFESHDKSTLDSNKEERRDFFIFSILLSLNLGNFWMAGKSLYNQKPIF